MISRAFPPSNLRTLVQRAILFLAATLFLAPAGWTADEPGAGSNVETTKPWTPPPPPPDDFDWIQLKSGEWLKGTIKVMQDEVMEFDSEELDDLDLDLEDIVQIRSGGNVAVLFTDQTAATGRVEMRNKEVSVVDIASGIEQLNYPVGSLQGIAPASTRERDNWTIKGSVGVNTRSGNTRSTDMTTQLTMKRRTPNTRGTVDYLGNYSTIDDDETANNHRLSINYDIYANPKLFIRPLQFEHFQDVFQNIDYRNSYGVGAGYSFYDRSDLEWQVTAGPGYQVTKFAEVDAGAEEKNKSYTAVFGTDLEKELTKNLDFLFSYQLTVTAEDAGRFIHHTVGTLEIELTDDLDFDITAIWDRTEDPPPGAGGVVPLKDDFRLNFLIGVDM